MPTSWEQPTDAAARKHNVFGTMTYPISSDTIANPLLVALLRALSSCFGKAGKDFFVIGAAFIFLILASCFGDMAMGIFFTA